MRIVSTFLFVLAISTTAAHAAGTRAPGAGWVDPGWRRTVARQTVSFDEQGVETAVYEFELQAVTQAGVATIAQSSLPYDSYYESVTVSDLATVKADGTIIPVDPNAIKDQPAATDTTSPYFDQQRIRLVAFPNVAAGDKVRGRVTYAGTHAMLPGAFAKAWSQSRGAPPETMEVTLTGPASWPLHIAVRGATHTQEIVGDRIVHHVVFRHETPELPTAETDAFDAANRFEASTFADYGAFAAAFRASNARMAVPDAVATALAAQIVGAETRPPQKAERIYDWVARNIRYVGIGLKDGGYISQPAGAILAARYGDCKAHVTILKALLATQGIEADLVFANLEARYTLTQVATPNFDHAIAYIPSLDLFVDPTGSLYEFGSLSPGLYGKTVLNVDRGVLATIPVMRPENLSFETRTHYTLLPDGTRKAESILTGSGAGGALTRGMAVGLETIDRRAFVQRRLAEYGQLAGTGDYTFTDPRDLSTPFTIAAPFTIANALNLRDTAQFRLLPLSDPRGTLSQGYTDATHETAFRCVSFMVSDIATLDIPDAIHISAKPNDESYTRHFEGMTPYGRVTGMVEVSRHDVLSGRSLISEGREKISFSAPVCPASFDAEIKAALARYGRFERDAIVVTPAAVARVRDSSTLYADTYAAFEAGAYDRALVMFTRLARDGNADAQMQLGSMYAFGKGVAQDYEEAVRWYKLAAARNDVQAQAWLGYIYGTGLGVPQDRAMSRIWYRKAAENGDALSQNHLAFLYGQGLGGEKDMAQAVAWFEKAAALGNITAMQNLGCILQNGEGVPQDAVTAAKWYRKAADGGNAVAQFDLGLMYAEGRGVPTDFDMAATLFRQAAEQGNVRAQYSLGRMYERGIALKKDEAEAISWYTRAAIAGNDDAKASLAAMRARHTFIGRWLPFLSVAR